MRGSQTSQKHWNSFFDWCEEASDRHHDSKHIFSKRILTVQRFKMFSNVLWPSEQVILAYLPEIKFGYNSSLEFCITVPETLLKLPDESYKISVCVCLYVFVYVRMCMKMF